MLKQDAKYYNRSLLLIVREQCLLLGKRRKPILVKDIVICIMSLPDWKGEKKNLYRCILRCCHHLEISGMLNKQEVMNKKKKIMYQFFLKK